MSEDNQGNRLAPLDGLRGLASLAIQVLHYRFLSDGWNDLTVHKNPYWDPFMVIYKFGWLAVEFFFILSGFIFFWKYGQVISDKTMSLTKFAMLRLTRLYPLHFAMLILVSILQFVMYQKTGATWVYQNHDYFHFILHALFLNYGWVDSGHSFNAPAWSIALEVGLYFLFYALCFGRRNRTLIALAATLFFFVLNIRGPFPNLPFMNEHFARVGYCFFLGGLLYAFHEKVQRHKQLSAIIGSVAILPAIVIIGSIHYFFMGHPAMSQLIGVRFNTVIVWGAFPMIVLAGLMQPTLAKVLGSKPFTFFGDISYSMYMIHFPILMCFHYYSISTPVDFYQKGPFWAYMVIVIGMSVLSYKYFEKPAMNYLRRVWKEWEQPQPRQAVATPAPNSIDPLASAEELAVR